MAQDSDQPHSGGTRSPSEDNREGVDPRAIVQEANKDSVPVLDAALLRKVLFERLSPEGLIALDGAWLPKMLFRTEIDFIAKCDQIFKAQFSTGSRATGELLITLARVADPLICAAEDLVARRTEALVQRFRFPYSGDLGFRLGQYFETNHAIQPGDTETRRWDVRLMNVLENTQTLADRTWQGWVEAVRGWSAAIDSLHPLFAQPFAIRSKEYQVLELYEDQIHIRLMTRMEAELKKPREDSGIFQDSKSPSASVPKADKPTGRIPRRRVDQKIKGVVEEIRVLKARGFGIASICKELGDKPRPAGAAWAQYSWPEAHKRYPNPVKKWISTHAKSSR